LTGMVNEFATGALGTVDLRVAPDGSLYYLARGQNQVFRVVFTGNQPTLPFTTVVGGDRQAFALDSDGTLFRIRDGIYSNAGWHGREIAVSNVGDDNPSNDVVFLLADNIK